MTGNIGSVTDSDATDAFGNTSTAGSGGTTPIAVVFRAALRACPSPFPAVP